MSFQEQNATQIYIDCVIQNPENAQGLLTCLAAGAMSKNDIVSHQILDHYSRGLRNVTILFAGALSFFMQAGFAMVCAGAVRRKNLQNTMLKNLLDVCGAAVAFYAVGFAFAYGGDDHDDEGHEEGTPSPNGFIGTSQFFLRGVDDMAFFFFQYAFSAAAATIVAGTLAERCQMAAYLCYSIFLSGFVYPVVVHAIWSPHGFLSSDVSHNDSDELLFGVGVIDTAGSGAVHLTGGITALIATYILGPRRGRFHDEETGEILKTPKEIRGHNIGLQLLGTLILWFGWYGFNLGSAYLFGGDDNGDILMSVAVTNTTLAAGAAGITTLFLEYYYTYRTENVGHYDLLKTMNGVLAGCVAITAGCGVLDSWAALIVGAIAGYLYLASASWLIKLRLDDAVDAIPVHMFNGIWGMLAVGLFASPEYMELAVRVDSTYPGLMFRSPVDYKHHFNLLWSQCVGVLFIMAWCIGIMMPFFYGLKVLGIFRVHANQEVVGLDKHYFGHEAGAGGDSGVTVEDLNQFAQAISVQMERRQQNQHDERRRKRQERRGSQSGDVVSINTDSQGDDSPESTQNTGVSTSSPLEASPPQEPTRTIPMNISPMDELPSSPMEEV